MPKKSTLTVQDEETYDFDEIRIFTPEVLSQLTQEMKYSYMDPKTGEQLERALTVDDFEVKVFRKKKKRSSGELLIINGVFQNGSIHQETSFKELTFYRNTDELREFYKQTFHLYEASNDYLDNLHLLMNELPSYKTIIKITHDLKSFSYDIRNLRVKSNKHYRGERIIYSYKETRTLKLYKQTRKNVNDYYLRTFNYNISCGEFPPLAYDQLVNGLCSSSFLSKILRIFLAVENDQSLEDIYYRHAFPVLYKIFPGNFSHLKELSFFSGWRHAENNTLTKALTKHIGFKPRKDFVRAIAQLGNKGQEDLMKGAINLLTLKPYYDFGFDLEDTIIKSLQNSLENDSLDNSPIKYFTHRLYNYSFNTLSSIALFIFCGPTLSKRLLMNHLPYNMEFMNFMSRDILGMIVQLTEMTWERQHYINRGYNPKKTNNAHTKALIQEIEQAIRGINNSPQRLLRDYDWNNNMNLLEVHNSLARFIRREGNFKNRTPELSNTTPVPENSFKKKIQELKPITIDNDTYKFVFPSYNKDIYQWANHLNNCMGGYVSSVQNKKYALVFVEKNDNPYAALGLRIYEKKGEEVSYRKEQFYRTNNLHLPSHVEEELLEAIL